MAFFPVSRLSKNAALLSKGKGCISGWIAADARVLLDVREKSITIDGMAMLAGTATWAEIDLDAVASNVSAFIKHVGEKVEIIAVVKASAYGHGAPVAKAGP